MFCAFNEQCPPNYHSESHLNFEASGQNKLQSFLLKMSNCTDFTSRIVFDWRKKTSRWKNADHQELISLYSLNKEAWGKFLIQKTRLAWAWLGVNTYSYLVRKQSWFMLYINHVMKNEQCHFNKQRTFGRTAYGLLR